MNLRYLITQSHTMLATSILMWLCHSHSHSRFRCSWYPTRMSGCVCVYVPCTEFINMLETCQVFSNILQTLDTEKKKQGNEYSSSRNSEKLFKRPEFRNMAAAAGVVIVAVFVCRFHKFIHIFGLSVGTFKCKHLIKLQHRLAIDDNIFCKYSHAFRSALSPFWQLWLLNQTTEQTERIVIVMFVRKFRKQIRLFGTARAKCKLWALQHANIPNRNGTNNLCTSIEMHAIRCWFLFLLTRTMYMLYKQEIGRHTTPWYYYCI